MQRRPEEEVPVPNYEYQCSECANRFEIRQSVGEAAPSCPACAAATKKVFHAPRVIFKGSGFYVTDLRAEKEARSNSKADNTKTDAAATANSSEATGDATSGDAASRGASKAESQAKSESKPPATTTQSAAADKK